MGAIEGIIVLSSTNEPILTSRFVHPSSHYPFYHTDQLVAKLEQATANAADGGASSYAFAEQGVSGTHHIPAYGATAGEVLPVVFIDNLPHYPELSGDDDDDSDNDDDDKSDSRSQEDQPWSVEAELEKKEEKCGAALVHIQHNRLRFVATFSKRVDPLLPLTFLKNVLDNLEKYLGSPLTEEVIKENFDIVYQLIEEMLDESGQPLNTEYNTLREIVREPSWLDSVMGKIGAVSGFSNAALGNAVSAPQLPAIPWRRSTGTATRAARNEVYFDLIETVSGVYGRGPSPSVVGSLSLDCQIDGKCKLQGTPDLLLRLNEGTRRIVDTSLHPCVRLRQWRKEQVLSFVPPDGRFVLANLSMQSTSTLPKHVPISVQATRTERSGKNEAATFQITLSCASTVEDIQITFAAGETGSSVESTLSGGAHPGVMSEDVSSLKGTFHFDAKTCIARWSIPRLSNEQRPLQLSGSMKSDGPARFSNSVTCTFSSPLQSLSGLKIASLEIVNDAHGKAFKGVRSTLRGNLDWRW